MTRHRYSASGLCLALILIVSLTSNAAYAAGGTGNEDRPIRLYATETFGPIGKVAGNSLVNCTVAINGRVAHSEQMIWNGDLIEATAGTRNRVLLDSVGQVTLRGGAMVRLATTLTTLDDNSHRSVLIASLTNGDMAVSLQPEATAYIEASGSAFTASSGAHFCVGIREGRAVMKVASGDVRAESQVAQRDLKIRLVKPNPDPLKPPIDLGLRLDVETRATRDTQWQVTDEHDKPVPDLPLTLTIVGKIGGFGNASTFTGTTNAQGIVNAPFTAGPSPAQGSINANIPGTNVSSSAEVRVKSKSPLTRNRILMAAAAAAAVVATIVIIGDPGGPQAIRQVPPPTSIP